jgi:hypothetical protein
LLASCRSASISISVRGPLERREYPGGRGTFISGLAVGWQNPDTVYAAVPGRCRIFKSVDDGRSWRNVGLVGPTNPLHDWESQCVWDFWAGRGHVLYASTVDDTFESSDAARSWHKISGMTAPEPQQSQSVKGALFPVSAVARDPRDSRVIYASTLKHYGGRLGGVFKSADGGRTWRRVALTGLSVGHLAIARNGKALYASTLKGAVIKVRLTD